MVAWDVAWRNAGALFGQGTEPYEPPPSAVVSDASHRRLRRYRGTGMPTGNPVLLVPPLAVTISCYDLRPAQSLVRFLQGLGREVHVVEYGEITYADRHLGFEEWVDDIVPGAIPSAASVAAGTRVLTGSPEVRFVEVDGSHLGIIAGVEAPATTWAAIAEFLAAARLQQA